MLHKRGFLCALCLLLLSCMYAMAQSPNGFSYQAIVRNSSGQLVSNQQVSVKIQVLSGSVVGSVVYSETHTATTNQNGLLTLIVGNGNVLQGSLSTISWSDGIFFIQTDIDLNGGVNYTISSTTQLLSVPYALYATQADQLSGTVSYNQLTDIPDNIGFSGDYNDLQNQPDLFDGDYSSLTNSPTLSAVATSGDFSDLLNIPTSFSGNYNDLQNKPVLSTVATTGDYNDLQNKPVLSTVAITGSYESLSNKPLIFSGSYLDLSNRPSIGDTVRAYSFSGNYYDLIGRPTLATVATTGSYNDLTDLPHLSADGTFSGRYADLSGLPSFPDSISKYAVGGIAGVSDYNSLNNRPNIRDSVSTYSFSGNYSDLSGAPELSAVATTGSYRDLTNKPNIKDSVDTYGFSGDFEDLSNKPEGRNTGDLMYWDEASKTWTVLSKGNKGDVLLMGEDGELLWTNLSYAIRNASKVHFDTLFVIGYDSLEHGTVTDANGFINTTGLLEFPEASDIEITITPDDGYGISAIYVDEQQISSLDDKDTLNILPYYYLLEKNRATIEFEALTGNHTLKVQFKQTILRVESYVDTLAPVTQYVAVPYSTSADYTLAQKTGYGISNVLLDGVNVYSELKGRTLTFDATQSDTLSLKVYYEAGLKSIGDTLMDNGIPSVIYAIDSDSYYVARLYDSTLRTWAQTMELNTNLTDGWSIPSISTLLEINNFELVLYTLFNGNSYRNGSTYLWSSDAYTINTSMSYGLQVSFNQTIIGVDFEMNTVVVKQISR